MTSKANWANDYVESFRGQDEGWFVYPPIKSSTLKPGMCGYFDIDGMWQTIIDLGNPEEVKAKNLPPVHGVVIGPGMVADTKVWGLRRSTGVEAEDISGSMEAKSVLGAPDGAGIVYKFTSTAARGALLVTNGPVTYRQATPNGPLCEWVVQNGNEIMLRARKPKRGVWIITKTYSANQRLLSVLSTTGSAVSLGIDAAALNKVAELRASGSIWREHSAESWNKDEDAEGLVLAMCGIQWKPRYFSSKSKPVDNRKRQTLAGEKGGDIILRPFHLTIDPSGEENVDGKNDTITMIPEQWGGVTSIEICDDDSEEDEKDEDDEDEDEGRVYQVTKSF